MKGLTTLVFLFVISVLFSQFTSEDYKVIGNKLKKYKNLQARLDKHNNIMWVRQNNFLNSRIETKFDGGTLYLYYGLKKVDEKIVKTPMRLHVDYRGDDWLFIEQISFALLSLKDGDESRVQSCKLNCDDPARKVLSGGVREVCDMQLNDNAFKFFKQMSSLKRMVTIRLSGKDFYKESAMFGKKLMKYEGLIQSYENDFDFQ